MGRLRRAKLCRLSHGLKGPIWNIFSNLKRIQRTVIRDIGQNKQNLIQVINVLARANGGKWRVTLRPERKMHQQYWETYIQVPLNSEKETFVWYFDSVSLAMHLKIAVPTTLFPVYVLKFAVSRSLKYYPCK